MCFVLFTNGGAVLACATLLDACARLTAAADNRAAAFERLSPTLARAYTSSFCNFFAPATEVPSKARRVIRTANKKPGP